MVKGKGSFFICNEVKTGIQSKIAKMCELKESSRVDSTISSGNPIQPSHGLVTPSRSQKAQENYALQSSEDKRMSSSHYAFDVNVEVNTFIASLNKMTLPEWSGNDSNRCTELSKLAETIVLLNSLLHLERKRCDEIKN